ncbi:MAG TPA: hypothetical protein VHA75_16690, partial [Rugosimonospora sp.]|nr:hypothetical protein [Rugosimonospora sp.]
MTAPTPLPSLDRPTRALRLAQAPRLSGAGRRAGLAQRLLAGAAAFEPRGLPLTAGRALLAAATLCTLALTADRDLFVPSTAWPAGPRCDGLRAATLWCVGPDSPQLLPARRVVAVAVLAVVLAGLSPRWTCVPHWYVTASLGTAMTVPNGGDSAARIAALLLIPVCL